MPETKTGVTRWLTRDRKGKMSETWAAEPKLSHSGDTWNGEGESHTFMFPADFMLLEQFCELVGIPNLAPGDGFKLTITHEPIVVPPTDAELAAELRSHVWNHSSLPWDKTLKLAADRLDPKGGAR